MLPAIINYTPTTPSYTVHVKLSKNQNCRTDFLLCVKIIGKRKKQRFDSWLWTTTDWRQKEIQTHPQTLLLHINLYFIKDCAQLEQILLCCCFTTCPIRRPRCSPTGTSLRPPSPAPCGPGRRWRGRSCWGASRSPSQRLEKNKMVTETNLMRLFGQ